MDVILHFTDNEIEYLKTKFNIEDELDLKDCIYECINTYMEL